MGKMSVYLSVFGLFFGCGPVLAQYAYAPMAGSSGDICYWLFQDGQKPVEIKGFDLARETARPGLVELPEAPAGAGAITCVRSSPIPKLNDYETVLRGYPLLLRVSKGDEITIVAVGVKGGQFYASIPQGSITSEQRGQLAKRLDEFLDAYHKLDTE